jgi:hypothetical protein
MSSVESTDRLGPAGAFDTPLRVRHRRLRQTTDDRSARAQHDRAMNSNPPRQGNPNQGAGEHSLGHSQNPLVVYEMSGTVRWLDADLDRIVLNVSDTDGHAGMFRGRDVTVDVEAARLNGVTVDGLVPGTAVRVKTHLPRNLGADVPDLVSAASVSVL